MSTTEFSDPNKIYKNPFHRRNDSGELDVFEATRYFSGATEVSGCRSEIISLQVPPRNSSPSNSKTQVMDKPIMTTENKKSNNQPNSPGGKIAHFLNSLFNQTGSKKKKKSKSTTPQSMKDHEFDESSQGGRRKRRSSISHFGGAPVADPKPSLSASNSGSRTPPPYANTPTKAYKDLRSYSDHKLVSFQKRAECAFLDGKLNFPSGCTEKIKTFGNGGLVKDGIWDGKCQTETKELRKFDDLVDDDDGAESDSSSDLFELKNYDLGYHCSSGLPVYETTHMDSIKRGAPRSISNGAV
ncbi:hypothetical protein Vadar_008889 [Vaccinium darrowii]|uniref:Uncharacterized protein n=1 Tax=Vaccinium darrowii TaxID=229202 RepID=A0ACB7WZ57_9ERIC|nr:hypothetical protein Vadar_008889 [Vaccinium darrowii]